MKFGVLTIDLKKHRMIFPISLNEIQTRVSKDLQSHVHNFHQPRKHFQNQF